MQVAVLGSLTVNLDGRPTTLPRPKERLLLCALAWGAGAVVPLDYLIDALWGDHPPPSANGSLRSHVRRLRTSLGDDVVRTAGGGYALGSNVEIDKDRFESLIADARRAPVEFAVEALREALALWRGAPFVELERWPRARAAREHLAEMHRTAEEEWASAELECGHGRDVEAALEAMVTTEPFREHRWALLMLAKYHAGRQADALRTYQRARRTLRDELGLEPCRELVELERAVLTQEPPRERGLQPSAIPPIDDEVDGWLRAAAQLRRAGHTHDAEQIHRRAATEARSRGDAALLARVALASAGSGSATGVDPGALPITLLEEACERLAAAPTSQRAHVLARLAVASASNAESSIVIARAREALRIAQVLEDRDTMIAALHAVLAADQDPAHLNDLERAAADLLSLAGNDSRDRLLALPFLGRYAAVRGDLDAARRRFDEIADIASQGDDDAVYATHAAMFWHMLSATLDFDLRKALAVADRYKASATAALADPDAPGVMHTGIVAVLHALADKPSPVPFDGIPWPLVTLDALARIGSAAALARAGALEQARRTVEPLTAEKLAALPRDNYWPALLRSGTQLCLLLGDGERAEALYAWSSAFSELLLIDPAGIFLGLVDHQLGILARIRGVESLAADHLERAVVVQTGLLSVPRG